jgi:tRNA (guanine-N7-)-methyltransferase
MPRRKQLKNTQFETFPNTFREEAKSQKGRWQSYFHHPHPITLELGCGTAELSYGLAKLFPERNFIGIDLKPARLWQPAGKALQEGIPNMAFLCCHLLQLEEYFAPGEVAEIWITFPDPFPKHKQSKHRMINPNFLKIYQNILQDNGKIHFKTDNLDLFHYSLEVFVRQQNIRLHQLSFDLHQDGIYNEEIGMKTYYEKKFMAEGIKIKYLCMGFQA